MPSTLTDHTVLIGYGRVGRIVAQVLAETATPFLVIETGDKRVAEAKGAGIEIIAGNAANPNVLRLANLAAAQRLFIAIPEAFEAGQIADQARRANGNLAIIARAHSDAEAEHLARLGADIVIIGEREIARAMIDWMAAPRLPQPTAA
jgi:CPA2 family monovalent cation:H+ antiporter-2